DHAAPRFLDVAAWSSTLEAPASGTTWRTLLDGAERFDPWVSLERGEHTVVQVIEIDPVVVARMTAAATERGTTLFAALFAGAAITIGHQWGSERPLLQIATSARFHPDAERTIGRFAQSRPLAGDLRGESTVGEVIRRAGRDLLTVLDVERAPLHEAIAALPASGQRGQLPSVHLQLRAFPSGAIPSGAPSVVPSDVQPDGNSPLAIAAIPRPDGSLRVVCRISPPIGIALDEVAGLARRIIRAACEVPAFVDRPWLDLAAAVDASDVTRLPDPEAILTRSWDHTVVDRILFSAAARPEAVAIDAPDGAITYRTLLARAETVAHGLRTAGMAPGDAVVITGPPAAGVAVAMLGVLLARGVMVPLPAELPDGALAERVAIVAARHSVVVGMPRAALVPTMVLDEAGRLAGEPGLDPLAAGGAPNDRPGPDDAAYIFFTSGSSGYARSVVGLHGSLAQFIDWQCTQFGIGQDDRVAMLTSIGFDVILRNVFLPWVAGGCLVVPPTDLDPDGVLSWIADSDITVVHLSPARADMWAMGDTPRATGALRWTFFSGEALRGTTVRRWRGALARPGNIVNLYGPTETCMIRSFHCVPDVVDDSVQSVGWALPGSQLLVVDAFGRRVGADEPGEIVIRTVHGTAGYGNDPDAWAARATLGPAPGETRYRTGDAGWYRDDGALMIAGRLDDEVKVNDVRVDPADIANRLQRLPGVETATVITVRDAAGRTSLLAAVVPTTADMTATELRTALAAQVPTALVPRQIVLVDRIPLTPNGKVDRPDLVARADSLVAGSVVPTGSVAEDQMVRIWQTLFPDQTVTADSNFFDIGGHSLIALRLIHRIKAETSVALPLSSVFSADTPAAMARFLDGHGTVDLDVHVPADLLPVVARQASVTGDVARLPVSEHQRQFLDLYDIEPALGSSPIGAVRVLLGPLDLAALQTAVDALAARHWAMRTWFDVGRREQIIAESVILPVRIIDHRHAPLDDRDLHGILRTAAGADLQHWPLITPVLVRLRTDQHVFALIAEHAVADAMSTDILMDDLRTLYEAHTAGMAPSLPAIAASPADVLRGEHQLAADGTIDTELAYWRTALAGALPALALPTDRPRGAAPAIETRTERLRLPPSVRARLDAVAAEHGTTPFRALTALWAAYLSRLVDRTDGAHSVDGATFTTAAAVREVPGAADMAGMFVSRLPLLLRFGPTVTVAELIGETDAVVAAAGRHRHVGFRRIRDDLGLGWDDTRAQPFDTAINLMGWRERDRDGDGLRWRWAPDVLQPLIDTLELRCLAAERRHLTLAVQYDGALFDRRRIASMTAGFGHFLAAGLAAPATQIASLPMPAPAAAHRRTHQRIADHAANTPDRSALVEGDRVVSFGELDDRINAMANALRAAGVQPCSLVAVLMGRGVDVIATLFAVHRVGAGYVVLWLDAPAARLEMILADTRPTVLVADRAPGFATTGVEVLRTDEAGTVFDATDPHVDVPDEAPAYVVYTSGSTGKPKGVVISHRALDAYVDAARERYGNGPTHRVLQAHTMAFDVSVQEIFTTLSAGGTLIIADENAVFGGVAPMFALVEHHQINQLVLPTSYWHSLVREMEESGTALPATVRHIIIGGQLIDPDVVRRWHRLVPQHVRLTASYGPAETTVYAVSSELTPENLRDGSPTPIGVPFRGVATMVVDDQQRVVADGEIGELLLAGPQVAEGYLGRPDLTAERFIELAGERWYRSGDMVRTRADGELEFQGRRDNQIKIRGCRIEPGEVEAALLALPRVREAVAVASGLDADGDPSLVAHVLVTAGLVVEPRALRTALAPTLPVYMLPAAVVVHEEFPRTTGGKPDRQMLAAMPFRAAGGQRIVTGPTRRSLTSAPLSFAQERFWLLRQLDGRDSYQVPLSFHLVGRLDHVALQTAVDALVSRHEILRTRYVADDAGVVSQVVDPPASVPIASSADTMRRPFDLARDWPVRVALMPNGNDDHTFLIVLHHIACDAESIQTVMRDLSALYSAAAQGRVPALPAPALQFTDQAAWDRDRMTNGDPAIAADLGFWMDELEGLPEPPRLPRRPDSAGDDGAGGVLRTALPADTVRAIRRTAATLRVTPGALVFTAIGIGIGRILGADDFVLGLPVTTRSFDGDADLVGPMINTLPFRFRSRPTDSVHATIRRVFGEMTRALERRHAPFEAIVAATHARRVGTDSPLVHVMANVFHPNPGGGGGNDHDTSLNFHGLQPVSFAPDENTLPEGAKFDLTVTARIDEGVSLLVEHSTALEEVAVAGWTALIGAVIGAIAIGGDTTIEAVPSVGADVASWLRDDLNNTARPYPRDSSVVELVEAAVAAGPERIALVDGTTRATYRELDELASGLARRLADVGVVAGDRVVIVLDRSTDLVATMLAVLRLDAVYVPIDPGQPYHRTDVMIADSGAVALVRRTQGIDLTIEPLTAPRATIEPPRHDAVSPAAVMYTSGSTGAPKGVVVPHRAIVRLVQGTDYLQLGPDDVVAFAANPGFDAAIWEVWGALTNGATVVVIDRDVLTSAHRLADAVRTHGVTAMFVTTALFNHLASEMPDALASVATVLFGGEACDPAAVRRMLDARSSGRLLHVYGPTECVTFALWHHVQHVADDATTVPIGLPIGNTTAHVLDDGGRLVPPGVVGELYLGGDGLALGYLGDPELTAQRFITDHLHPGSGGRLYRTGDLVRRSADGLIEFTGRADRQVKVRGYRVQPEDVEAALMAHAAVTAAVVEAGRDAD
ncbi:MAG: amino acid adenylation domain-containing protein, partial [Actinomycetota bacterium]